MFDPTVWDNLKVVLEGAVYDLDMDGVISIIDRNDLVNLAKMSRSYEIDFNLKEGHTKFPHASIILYTDIDNLAVELREIKHRKPGCKLEIQFFSELYNYETECPKILKLAKEIWGENRCIEQKISFQYTNFKKTFFHELIISFDRDIYEENIDDLLEMIPFMVETLKFLKK